VHNYLAGPEQFIYIYIQSHLFSSTSLLTSKTAMKVTLPECAQDNSDNKQRMLCLKAHLTVNIMALNDT